MLYTDSTLAWHIAHERPLHTNNTKSPGSANNTDKAEGVKCLIHSCSREKREKKRRGGVEKKKEKTKKQAQPSHLPHSPTIIEPAEGAISAGSHGGSGEPLKPITVARASTLD